MFQAERPWQVWALAALVLALGLGASGAGPANGDAAVYAASALAHEPLSRATHAGWVALLALFPDPLGAGDALTALAAAAGVLAVGRRAGRWAALAWAGLALPYAAFGEVDLPWMAALIWAVQAPFWWSALLMAVATAFSPVALLALPVGWRAGRGTPLLLGAALAVLALTLWSEGGWWWGPRGLWSGADTLNPWHALGGWSAVSGPGVAWLALAAAAWIPLIPLALAPPDVPAYLLLGAVGPPLRGPLLSSLIFAHGLLGLAAERQRITWENAVIAEVVASLPADTGLIATWSWGVRASLLATGDPYALDWRTPAGVRDQVVRWNRHSRAKIVALPPGHLPAGYVWRLDDKGVAWSDCPAR